MMAARAESRPPRGQASARRANLAAAILLAALKGGCENDDAILGVQPMPAPGAAVSLRAEVQPIFNSSCARSFCHAAPLAGPMSLEPGATFAQNVGVPSCQAPPLRRVEPGSSAASYLVMKLEGTQSSLQAGGGCLACTTIFGTISDCGVRMPLGGAPIADAQIQLIRRWIDEGAPDN